MSMQLLVTGTGDAFTSTSYGTSCVLQGDQGPVLVDCPDPIRRVLRQASEKSGWEVTLNTIDDILLTHLHGDHSNGLEAFGFWRRAQRVNNHSQPLPRLHTTSAVAERLWSRLAAAMDTGWDADPRSHLSDYFDVRIIDPDHFAVIQGIRFKDRYTHHPIPTIGIRASCHGITNAWSGDTFYDESHIEWLKDADLIIHEAGPPPIHTPVERLEQLPEEIRSKMWLNHLPDEFNRDTCRIPCLTDGQILKVTSKGTASQAPSTLKTQHEHQKDKL